MLRFRFPVLSSSARAAVPATLPLGIALGAAQELISVAAPVAALLVLDRRVPAGSSTAVGQDSEHDPAE